MLEIIGNIVDAIAGFFNEAIALVTGSIGGGEGEAPAA